MSRPSEDHALQALVLQLSLHWTPSGRLTPAGDRFWSRVAEVAQRMARAVFRGAGHDPEELRHDVAQEVCARLCSKPPAAWLHEARADVVYSEEWFLETFVSGVARYAALERLRALRRAEEAHEAAKSVSAPSPMSRREREAVMLQALPQLLPAEVVSELEPQLRLLLELASEHGDASRQAKREARSRSAISKRRSRARRLISERLRRMAVEARDELRRLLFSAADMLDTGRGEQ